MIFETLSASNIKTTRALTIFPAQRPFDIGLRGVANGIGHLDTGTCPPVAPSATVKREQAIAALELARDTLLNSARTA
jgi:hypothetical protein